jgi:hypothetical protein
VIRYRVTPRCAARVVRPVPPTDPLATVTCTGGDGCGAPFEPRCPAHRLAPDARELHRRAAAAVVRAVPELYALAFHPQRLGL